jgi:histone H3/H4
MASHWGGQRGVLFALEKEGVPMSSSEVLVVVSKLKSHIREQSGMNTAANVAPALSDIIRRLCDQAVEKARADGRKTVMDRDFT